MFKNLIEASGLFPIVHYQFLESMWMNWYNHVIAEDRRSIPLNESYLSCTDDYMEWLRYHSVVRVQNPNFLPNNVMQGASSFHPTYEQLYTVKSIFSFAIFVSIQLDFCLTFFYVFIADYDQCVRSFGRC